jgi:hypothetical protein
LPGGIKRESSQINDDTKPIMRNNYAFTAKMAKDYNSNVSCLPCRLENNPVPRAFSPSRNYQKTDIFNTKPEVNSFKQGRKKDIRDFRTTDNEKRLIPDKLTGRPTQIRDVFRSQITIS